MSPVTWSNIKKSGEGVSLGSPDPPLTACPPHPTPTPAPPPPHPYPTPTPSHAVIQC
jgi:hypothetical protein